jgi:hypothetical protein
MVVRAIKSSLTAANHHKADGRIILEIHPESPPATMGSSFRRPSGGLEDQQRVEKVLDFSCIYDIA